MTGVPVVEVHDVSKRFVIRKEKSLKERVVNFGRSNAHKDDFWALRDVDFAIDSGSTVGLIGRNGSGKSTLLKLIGGILQPTSGRVTRRGRLAALIELGAGFHPDLTGRENVFLNCAILGLTRAQTEAHFDAIVDFSGIEQFIDTQVKFYSSGMYVRLAFAVAVHVDPDVLLVDEVLAVGDEPFQRKCMDRIHSFQNDGRTIIIVTHALDQIGELCDRAIVLDGGRVLVDGAPRDALRLLRANFEVTRNEERERERERSTDTAEAQRATRARVAAVRLCAPAAGGGVTAPASSVSIAPGDALSVDVTVIADEPLRDWVLGVGVDLPSGHVVYGTNTKLLDVGLPALTGPGVFRLEFPALWLGEGSYGVHAAIAEHSGVEVHRLAEGATLQVLGDGGSIGALHARPTVRPLGVPATAPATSVSPPAAASGDPAAGPLPGPVPATDPSGDVASQQPSPTVAADGSASPPGPPGAGPDTAGAAGAPTAASAVDPVTAPAPTTAAPATAAH